MTVTRAYRISGRLGKTEAVAFETTTSRLPRELHILGIQGKILKAPERIRIYAPNSVYRIDSKDIPDGSMLTTGLGITGPSTTRKTWK